MIVFERVTKVVDLYGAKRHILLEANIAIPSNKRIALLTQSNEEKKIFIDLVSGVMLPSSGRISRKSHVSFPVGNLMGFDADLSVRLNIAHVGRIYGVNSQAIVNFVEKVAELGEEFDGPFRSLSPSKRKRLGYVLGYALPFDIYVLAEEPAKGPIEHRELSYSLFKSRSQTAGMIIPTKNIRFMREHCDICIVLANGRLNIFGDVESAAAEMEGIRRI